MNEISRAVITFLVLVLLTSTIHWSLHVLYSMWCAPNTIEGLLSSFFTLGSPLCQFINYVQFELSKHYITIWGTAGLALFAFLAGKLTIQTK